MKKLWLLVLITAFVFTAGIGEVYSAALTAASANSLSTGAITIDTGSFSRQTSNLTFSTSNEVYMSCFVSTSRENYTVSGGHKSGDKSYAMASGGGTMYWITKTAGSTTITAAPGIADDGSLTVGSWSTM